MKIAPSILAADFARLGEQVAQAELADADRIHVDVMDGHFVPNISIGPMVVRSLRPVTRLPLETHLMVSDPDRYLDAFAEAGSTSLLVHIEGNPHVHRTIQRIHSLGLKAGIVLNPSSPASLIEDVLPEVELALVMTVNPGFGGQKFIDRMLPKIRRVRELIDLLNPDCELEVDGGIHPATAAQVAQVGATVLVAGSSIFGHPDGIAAAIGQLHSAGQV